MRHYILYLLKEDVASEYYGKESLVYHLFSEYYDVNQKNNEYTTLLGKQVQYISSELQVMQLKQFLEQELENRTGFTTLNDSYIIHRKHLHRKSSANLTITNDCLQLRANGNYEAETIFFEVLRKFAPSFLAMDFDRDQYGWLNPIKQRKFV